MSFLCYKLFKPIKIHDSQVTYLQERFLKVPFNTHSVLFCVASLWVFCSPGLYIYKFPFLTVFSLFALFAFSHLFPETQRSLFPQDDLIHRFCFVQWHKLIWTASVQKNFFFPIILFSYKNKTLTFITSKHLLNIVPYIVYILYEAFMTFHANTALML